MRKTFIYPTITKIKEGHLDWLLEQAKKVLVIKYLHKILPQKILVGPTMAILLVTYRCNSRCVMCDLAKRAKRDKEFTTKDWEDIIEQLAEIKTAGIGFTGGEPLLRPDMAKLIRFANQKGMSTTLNTNCLFFSPKLIAEILAAQPDNINISLDSAIPETYDQLRGIPNGFNRLIQNIKKLTRAHQKISPQTTITTIVCVSHHNVRELAKIAELSAELGADKIGFIPLHQLPNLSCVDKNPKTGAIFLSQIKKIKEQKIINLDNHAAYLKMFPLAFAGKKFPLHCRAGETSITIDSLGNIYGCWPFLELNSPGLRLGKKRLKELWFSQEYKEIRKKTSACRNCFWNCHSELSIFYR